MNTHELRGLDGANPLGMLAALGALRVATVRDDSSLMGWHTDSRVYPFLSTALTLDELAVAVCEEARRVAGEVASAEYGDVIRVPTGRFRELAAAHVPARGDPGRLSDADYFSAWASDAVSVDDEVSPTLLSFSNRSGNQLLLKDFRSISARCVPAEVAANLTEENAVIHSITNLNWDPVALRSYALRWRRPDNDPKETNCAANALAFLGLSFLTVVPIASTLATTGVVENRAQRRVDWVWPIWGCALSAAAVRSLLARTAALHRDEDRASWRSMGVDRVFSARRLTDNKRYYFSPAVEI